MIGNILTQDNNTLQVLLLTGSEQTLLAQELNDGEAFDEIMVSQYVKRIKERSSIKLLAI